MTYVANAIGAKVSLRTLRRRCMGRWHSDGTHVDSIDVYSETSSRFRGSDRYIEAKAVWASFTPCEGDLNLISSIIREPNIPVSPKDSLD